MSSNFETGMSPDDRANIVESLLNAAIQDDFYYSVFRAWEDSGRRTEMSTDPEAVLQERTRLLNLGLPIPVINQLAEDAYSLLEEVDGDKHR